MSKSYETRGLIQVTFVEDLVIRLFSTSSWIRQIYVHLVYCRLKRTEHAESNFFCQQVFPEMQLEAILKTALFLNVAYCKNYIPLN